MDENKEVNSTDPKREKVRVIPLSAIDDAPDHPFGVRDDDEMAELVESISTFGVINPVIRLNNLIPELLEDVDMGKIAFRPAVELSYLDEEEQKDLSYYIDEGEATPSLAQAIQMKKLSQAGVLTEERIEAILSEEKPNQKPKIKVPMERIQKYFSPDASVREIEDTIVKALSAYRRSQELQMAKANRTIKEAR